MAESQMRCIPCSELQYFTKRKEANGLYVTDLPAGLQERDLYNIFGSFGQIADIFFPESGLFCLVHYYDSYAVEDVLRLPVYCDGRELRIKRRQYSSDRVKPLSKIPVYHEDVLRLMSQKENCKEQVAEFVKGMQADASEFRKQSEACRDLENALKNVSQTYKIMPFGSSVTGLAFKDSDIDVFYGKESNSRGPDLKDVFNCAKKALLQHKQFVSIRPIPNARVPIIKLVHEPTGYNLDLSFRNTMGVENSRMIKFLMSLDERIKPLCMILKYWAKLHCLTGKRMSNYALILLTINFLQSLNDPILPPLFELQHDGIVAKRIGDWDANFDDDVTRLKPVSNTLPVEELLCRFFESVVKTDFDNYVVCPFMGSLIHRRSFHNSAVPQEMKQYIYICRGKPRLQIDSPLCLQDPIEMNLNVTKNLTKAEFQCFKDHCYIAAKLSYAVPPHLFLTKLLSAVFENPMNDVRKSWRPNPMHVGSLRPYMTLHVPHPRDCADEITWRSDLTQKVTLIFKKVLKINVELSNEDRETKPGADKSMRCRGSQVLWKNRDKLWKKWKECEVVICSPSSNDEVQVVHEVRGSASSSHSSSTQKRKRDDEEESEVKRRKPECLSNEIEETNVSSEADIICLDSNDTDVSVPRNHLNATVSNTSLSLQDEISLTNDMVRKGHALPAFAPILNFSCMICKSSANKTTIEITDRRSVNNHFSSLCTFLQDFLTKHIVEAENR